MFQCRYCKKFVHDYDHVLSHAELTQEIRERNKVKLRTEIEKLERQLVSNIHGYV